MLQNFFYPVDLRNVVRSEYGKLFMHDAPYGPEYHLIIQFRVIPLMVSSEKSVVLSIGGMFLKVAPRKMQV